MKIKILVACFVLLGLLNHMQIPVRTEMSAFEMIFNDYDHIVERTIRINGWYSIRFFSREHSFRGTIEILEYPETNSEFMFSPLRLTRVGNGGVGFRMGRLYYTGGQEAITIDGVATGAYSMTAFGTIYTRALLRHPIVIITANYEFCLLESTVVVGASTPAQARERLALLTQCK